MTDFRVPTDALVFVGDGEKALFLRNKGDALYPNLVVEKVLEQENPATRDQGTDQPGRAFAAGSSRRSSVEQTDWHRIAEENFADEVAERLYKLAHAGAFEKLVVIAPPRVLGNLRKSFHKEVADKVVGEIPKELTARPVYEIEKLLTPD
jgi:protein required for attachment to host cells